MVSDSGVMTEGGGMTEIQTLIAAFYESLLLRAPDAAGLETYTTLVKNGNMSLPDVLARVLRSDKFKNGFPAFQARYAEPSRMRFIHEVSQFGEIGLLIKRIVNEASPSRVVVDVGVRGRDGSNSYDLMRHFGWNGLLIEANPNPWLSSNSEFFMAAKKSGKSYTEMVETIIELARNDRRRRDRARDS